MRNYADGVIGIYNWLVNESEVIRDHNWELAIMDDHSKVSEIEAVKHACRLRYKRPFIYQIQEGRLRASMQHAASLALRQKMDKVLVLESDSVINDDILQSLIEISENPPGKWQKPRDDMFFTFKKQENGKFGRQMVNPPLNWGKLASVSVSYQWKGKNCYPTQESWFEPLETNHNCFQVEKTKYGNIGLSSSVPLLL